MLSQKIRREFFTFFEERGHTKVPSSSVIPADDPTLLFANAGMNQFKDLFLGKSKRSYTKACSSQKCIRVGGKHNDLENVGHTTRHLTFFEMLGNFSFGDYFKEKAIALAWEATLEIFGFDPKKLIATVFEEDDEAYELWKAFLPEERIVRMGAKDNFWAMGDLGPCGPCSELYFDKGSKWGQAKSPAEPGGEERYLEFWNLVFVEFNRLEDGKLAPLQKKSVDTGAGLERIIELKMGVDTVFETDILRALIAEVEKLSSKSYNNTKSFEAKAPFHVIADHLRTLAFAVADGAVPSNTERGYVLRKVLRRAVRYGKQVGLEKPFLANMLPTLNALMGDDFPELKVAQNKTAEILTLEEENFFRTLKRGGTLLNHVIEEAKKTGNCISGDAAFKLKDTYGLPLDEITLLATDAELTVDTDRFETLELEAKERSRASRKVEGQLATTPRYEALLEKTGATSFVGYHQTSAHGKITALIKEGKEVDTLHVGEEGEVLLSCTPFYAEKGGQVGDTGTLTSTGAHFVVKDTQTPFPGVVLHRGVVERGSLKLHELITATVDEKRRALICQNHTATHLLHYALQQVLGPHATQAGSVVEPHRLRFDFNHHKGLTSQEIYAIEDLVNQKIRDNQEVKTYELPFEEVQTHKEIKQFFGEKYGDTVRVVDINYSKELCGGNHVSAVGALGYFRIEKESAVASGVRRIEALTGALAEQAARQDAELLNHLTSLVKGQKGQVVNKVTELLETNKSLATHVDTLKKDLLAVEVENLFAHIEEVKSIPVLIHEVPFTPKELNTVADLIVEGQKSLCLFLAAVTEGRVTLLIRVSSDLINKGIKAGSLMKELAPIVKGRGGGRAEGAQGGGEAPEHLPLAFEKCRELIAQLVQ